MAATGALGQDPPAPPLPPPLVAKLQLSVDEAPAELYMFQASLIASLHKAYVPVDCEVMAKEAARSVPDSTPIVKALNTSLQ